MRGSGPCDPGSNPGRAIKTKNKMLNYPVPFYENTSDNTHCFQACLKMVLKYFFPEEDYSWKYLEKISAKVPGKWTWSMAALIWLANKDIEIKNIEIFDYKKFIDKKEDYLLEFYGKEVAKKQIENSSIPQEIEFSKKFIKEADIEMKSPDISDIKALLDRGFLIGCNVNSNALNNEEGYTGHYVIVRGYDSNNLFANDPGRPGKENKKISFETFEKAWAYPNSNTRNITAFKRKANN